MRFHVGLSFNLRKILKWVLPLIVGLFAYFGIANIQVLAATSITFEPSTVELCNNATNTCSTNWLEVQRGNYSIAYKTMSGYGAISTYKVYYDSSAFSYYCYESQYNFHATYELDYRLAYLGNSPITYGNFSAIRVYSDNVLIPSRTTQDSSTKFYTIKFDYPGYGKNIRIEFVQNGANVGMYPMGLYAQFEGQITCIDQTTLASVNQTIENSTSTIINNNNQNTQNITNSINGIEGHIDDSTQEIKDTLLDNTSPNIDLDFFDDMEWNSGTLTSLMIFPIDLLTTIINNQDTCNSVEFNLSSITRRWGGDDYVLRLPCIRTKMRQLLGNWYDVFDLLIAGMLFYYFASNLILKINDLLSGVDSMPYFYSSSSPHRTTRIGTYDKNTGEVIN